jgi:uncharacterized protein
MKWLVWGIIFLLVPAVFAQEGTIKLLALSERANGSTVGVAVDLDLQVEPGRGRVFLETFPLTKITTQISMRFAQQIACKELNVDCSRKDFFFTIRALPGIVGGPSAGSAAAVLAGALISKLKLRNDTAITGTINSGGVIGPVGGLKEKMQAAAGAGLKRVLIARGTRHLKDGVGNSTIDLVEYGSELGLEVIEVSTLLDALREYTGHDFPNRYGKLVIEQRYQDLMQQVAQDLCNRTSEIKNLLEQRRTTLSDTTILEAESLNFSRLAQDTLATGQYYSAASFCFRANVQLKQALALQRRWDNEQVAGAVITLHRRVENLSRIIYERPMETINDVQAAMAVTERLDEVEETLVEIIKHMNETKENAERLAYAEERLFSAGTWARFFRSYERGFVIDATSLRESCMSKISEGEERLEYVQSFLPSSLKETRRTLDRAASELLAGNYTMCLYTASKAKAEANVILNLIGVEEQNIYELIALKLDSVRQELVHSQERDIFPVIAYSYYEYADSLKHADRYSALLFAEYALELANLDIYFVKKSTAISVWDILEPHVTWTLAGLLIGVFIMVLLEKTGKKIRKARRKS